MQDTLEDTTAAVRESTARSPSRRRLLRSLGAAAGLLSVLGGASRASADDAEEAACVDPDTGGKPDELYLRLLARQRELRATAPATLDEDAIRTILAESAPEFDGHLIFFAASDFGKPRVFLPANLADPDRALGTILDRIHREKWSDEHEGLRAVRNRVFVEAPGIHQGLPAVYYGPENAAYDLTGPWDGAYNFVTIRQVVGLVDWLTNADEEWTDGRRLTYDSHEPRSRDRPTAHGSAREVSSRRSI